MKRKLKAISVLLVLSVLIAAPGSAQGSLLRKLKDRAEDEVVNEIFGEKNDKSANPQNQSVRSESSQSSTNSLSNSRGGGLTSTPPNVPVNITDAGSAFDKRDYRDARYAVRQAILGIEMEIGQNILDELPSEVKGLQKIPEEDKVSSMSIGFVGLTIERVYRAGDQQLKITVGNNAAILSSVNMYMTGAAYSSSEEQNHKQVKFKGYPGILEYDEYSGYTLSVPFGQSSVFVAGGINFSNEQEIMAAAEEIDIEKIKNELGEK